MPTLADLTLLEFAPDREWCIVIDLVSRGRLPSRQPEYSLRRQACHFLRRWRRATAVVVGQLREEYPEIFASFCLWSNQRSVKWVIEAGLLTPASYEDIGFYLGYSPAVIDTYEKLFFQVRDRIETRGYILNTIIMPAVSKGLSSKDFDYMYKVLAYCAGWKALLNFLELGEMNAETEGWLQASFRSRIKKMGWMAAHHLEINQYSALEIIEKCLEIQRAEKEHNTGISQDKAAELMKDLLEGSSLDIISSESKLPADEQRALLAPVKPYKGAYAQPRETEHGDGADG